MSGEARGLPTVYQQFIHKSRYARFNEELGRRETWAETVHRYTSFFAARFPQYKEYLEGECYQAILNLDVMPSMRAMWSAGKALELDNAAGYNCSAVAIDAQESFSEILYILMCGAGVGFSVENKFISKLPTVPVYGEDGENEYNKSPDRRRFNIDVEDSKDGWANGLGRLVKYLYDGIVPGWSLARIRPAGSRLRTFGGRASGPEPLANLFSFVLETFRAAQGRRLTSLEVHDIVCYIASAVISGGVRRSALISLSDLDDAHMRHAKTGEWWRTNPLRAYANNSAVYDGTPHVGDFMREWLSLYDSKSGERGIFNRAAAHASTPPMRKQLGYSEWLTNPCQPAWAKLLTPSGVVCLGDINVGDTVWSKEGWTRVVNKQSTGVKEVYRFATTAGVFYGTKEHRVVSGGVKREAVSADSIDIITGPYEVRKCSPQDIMDGLVIGDGMVHKASNNKVLLCIGKDASDYFASEIRPLITRERLGISEYAYEIETTITPEELPRTYERRIPDRFKYNLDKAVGFLRGLYSANGSVVGNRITLKSSSLGLVEDAQLILSALGIRSYFTTNRPTKVTFKNGEYECRESYDLNITTSREKFVNIIGFIQEYKNNKIILLDNVREKTTYDIVEVSFISEEEVFDITVDNSSHTYWSQGCDVSNCGEILLRNGSFCNLSEVVVRPHDTIVSLCDKVKVATFLGVLQSSLTDFRNLRSIWKHNCEEERLLGVSLTGLSDNSVFADAIVNGGGYEVEARRALNVLKECANTYAGKYARSLGLATPRAVTTVKPSGTVSQLVDSASGAHPRFSEYYIRTVRGDSHDPLTSFLEEAGVPCAPDVTLPDRVKVFYFPMKAPSGALLTDDVKAMDQYRFYSMLMDEYVDHNVSTTIYMRDNEWMEVGAKVYQDFNKIVGLSFLPHTDHVYEQAPYIKIDESRYEGLIRTIPRNINWEDLAKYEHGKDNTMGARELACSGDTCEIVDIS